MFEILHLLLVNIAVVQVYAGFGKSKSLIDTDALSIMGVFFHNYQLNIFLIIYVGHFVL